MGIVLIIFLAIVVGFALFSFVNIYPDNYVKIYVDTYLVEMSFTGFMILMFVIGVLIYLLLSFIGSSFKATTFFSRWRKRRGHKKAGEALGSGYLSLIKGDWRRAEKSLVSRSDKSSVPYVNYLAAAQAAQEQGQFDRRDEYLTQAYEAAPSEKLAIGLAKARLHHMANQSELAHAALDDIESQGRKNAQYVAMRLQNYQALGNWAKVHDLLPLARKQGALPEQVIEEMDTQAHRALLLEAKDKKLAWRELPKPQQAHTDNTLTYAKYLVHKGDVAAAEKLVRNTLGKQQTIDSDLVDFYGKLKGAKPAKMRRAVEGWLMARPENAHLNLAAGRLAALGKNKDVAVEYLEKAIALAGLPEAYGELGELLEAHNDSGKALQLYREGLARLASGASEETALESNVIGGSAAKADARDITPKEDITPTEGELIKA